MIDYPLNSLLVNGTNTYSFSMTDPDLTSQNYNGGVLPFGTEYTIGIFVSISTSAYVNGTTTGSVGQRWCEPERLSANLPPAGHARLPQPQRRGLHGQHDRRGELPGDFVSGATIDIYTTATNQLVYSAGVAVAGPGPHVGTAAATWRPTVAGAYTAILNLSGPYGYSAHDPSRSR